MNREEALARVYALLRKRGEHHIDTAKTAGLMVASIEALDLIQFSDPAQDEVNAAAWRVLQRTWTEIGAPPSMRHNDICSKTIFGRLTEYGAGCGIAEFRPRQGD
jgi:hypothetical protein